MGKRYKVSGVLMDKDRKKPILNKDGNEITSEKEFLAEHPSGEIELEFRYDSRLRQDKTTVVFETLLHENVPVAVHADINDESQSVRYPRVGTQLTGKDGVAAMVILFLLGMLFCYLVIQNAAVGWMIDQSTEFAAVIADAEDYLNIMMLHLPVRSGDRIACRHHHEYRSAGA